MSELPAPARPAPGTSPRPAFASVVLDVDSTLSGIEGIDWLAARRGGAVSAAIAQLTAETMNGQIPLEEVYGRRLELVAPLEAEVVALAEAYRDALAPRAAEEITRMREAGVRLALVSGGIRQAVMPLATMLGFTRPEVYAVLLHFDNAGAYRGFDSESPLTSHMGKAKVVHRLYLPRPLLAVGDGTTDLAMRPAADAFAAFTGFVRRPAVVREADHEVASFAQLSALVLP